MERDDVVNAPAALAVDAVRVHDLLALHDPSALRWDGAAPGWAAASLASAPWVVVRRVAPRDGLLAVGVRGAGREQRAAAWLEPARVAQCLRPTQLRARLAGLPPERAGLGAFALLARLEQAWRVRGPRQWGPGGSVGFELASGAAAAGAQSDLDVVVRCPRAPSAAQARAWLRALPQPCDTRLDVLLEWPAGGAALRELAAGESYLLRTPAGARLRRRRAGARAGQAA